MTDPRFTDPDPRSSDSRFDDPYLRRGESLGGVWFWVPALGFVLLIGALILANNYTNTASKDSSSTAMSSQPARTPPSTTGSASTAPQDAFKPVPEPMTPAPK
jgi:hypothetical protein